PILLTGEGGTGKTYLSAFIHNESGRSAEPFVVLRCAALTDGDALNPPAQHDNQLERCFAAVRGGTILLDEVSDLDPAAQARLMRAIEGVGSSVRILASTQRA